MQLPARQVDGWITVGATGTVVAAGTVSGVPVSGSGRITAWDGREVAVEGMGQAARLRAVVRGDELELEGGPLGEERVVLRRPGRLEP